MNGFEKAFKETKCINIRIDLTKNLPLTILGKFSDIPKKERKLNLIEFVKSEDLPPLINAIAEITSDNHKKLGTHFRIKLCDDYHWVYIDGVCRKDTFNNKAQHISGTLMNVSEYLQSGDDDMVIEEYRKKNAIKFNAFVKGEISLADMLGVDYLEKTQAVFKMENGIESAIYSDDGTFICGTVNDPNFNGKKYKFSSEAFIRCNHKTLAFWRLFSNNQQNIEKYQEIMEMLAQNISQIASAMIVLYNEMENSKEANQQLGSNVEQQILLNNIYTIILENKDSDLALNAVIELVGDYLKLDRIALYDYDDAAKTASLKSAWGMANVLPNENVFVMSESFPQLTEELEYCDTYFSAKQDDEIGKFGVKSYVVSQLSENGRFTGLIFYEIIKSERKWSQNDRKLLRNISQIISTMLIRCNMDLQLEKKNQQLRRLAFSDYALDIGNRTKLDRDLREQLSNEKRGVALSIKVTNMRSINEMFGHIYSDSLIRIIVEYIEEILEEPKMVYRFSGSALMVLLIEKTGGEAKLFTEKLLNRFKLPWQTDEAEHYMEACVGIAVYPQDGKTCDEIYRASSLSLYRAMEFGKNRYAFYSIDFKRPEGKKYYIEQKLRESVADNMTNFEILYQPVYSKNDGNFLYCEASLHWNMEEFTQMSSSVFMNIAENIGIDMLIDSWVIQKVCKFCLEMQQNYNQPDFAVSINLTMTELMHSSAVEVIRNAVQRSGIEPHSLILQVPEVAQLKLSSGAASVLGALKKVGVRIAVNNFANEFATLNVLKSSCVDMIIINQSLLTSGDEKFNQVMLQAVIELAHLENVAVCVKKLEFAQQVDIINKFDVDCVQGNYFSDFMKAEELRNSSREYLSVQTRAIM